MITRLMLSLKKTTKSPDLVWSFNATFQPEIIRFADHTIGGGKLGDDRIALKPLPPNSPPEP